MGSSDLILIRHFCLSNGIEISFIESLEDVGLIEIIVVNEEQYFPIERLSHVEKLVRLHQDLSINLEALDVVSDLLSRIQELKQENQYLRNKVQFYE